MAHMEYEKNRKQLEALAEDFIKKSSEVDMAPTAGPQAPTESQIEITLQGMASGRYRLIMEALQRLENGTYGRCDSCGRRIAPERLEIIPEALLCVDCQREEEKHAQVSGDWKDYGFDQLI